MALNKELHSDLFQLIWNPLYSIISQATKTQLEWGQLKKNRECEKEENKH